MNGYNELIQDKKYSYTIDDYFLSAFTGIVSLYLLSNVIEPYEYVQSLHK